jgi:predicted Zn-dependent protease
MDRKKFVWIAVIASCLISSAVCAGVAYADDNTNYTVDGQTSNQQRFKAAQAVSEGLALINSGQPDLALQKLQYAVQLDPAMPEAHHNLGYVLTKLGRTSEAITEFKKAMALGDNTESVYLSLGGLYQSSGQLDLAIQTMQQFLTRFPSSTQYNKIASLVQGLQQEYSQQLAHGGMSSPSTEGSDYFGAATASGFVRWPTRSMPLTVYIADGRNVPFYHAEYAAALQSAFQDWSNVSQGLISFVFVNSPSQALIDCSWSANPSTLSNAAEAGEATITKENGYILKAHITLLTVPLSPELPVTPNRLKASCLHEIGHALGIEGHSADPADIMFSSAELSDNPRNLSVRDCNTILRLYSTRGH